MKKLLFILLLIFFSTDIRSQGLPFYFSFGVQIGINSGGNTYFSNQLTSCILVQNKKELEEARAKLKTTKYYSYWDSKYLKEIMDY